MTRLVLLLIALLAAAGARAACEPGGMGGTGMRGDGGIGGTGIRAEGDVGIIGIITGFGSICVNGVEVEYDAATPISSDGAPAAASALALGQLVAVRAVGSGAQARAREIRILDALVGRAEAVDPAAGEFQVGNQRVRLAASTVLEPNVSLAELAGRSVRVSGLWRADGSLAATRIQRAPPSSSGATTYAPDTRAASSKSRPSRSFRAMRESSPTNSTIGRPACCNSSTTD